jgi:hypothetical protein
VNGIQSSQGCGARPVGQHLPLNGDTEYPVQEVIVLTTGRNLYRSNLSDEKPCTLAAVLLAMKGERDKGKQG